jgi:hypothetical protein
MIDWEPMNEVMRNIVEKSRVEIGGIKEKK